MGTNDDDPTAVRTVAVTAEDVVAAVEAQRQGGKDVVLRVTPPFSGRMRARLHVRNGDRHAAEEGKEAETEVEKSTDRDDGTPVVIEPASLIDDDAPAYPRASDTGDELRADPTEEYTVETHRDRHERAIGTWREAIPSHVVSETTIATADGAQTVTVVVLG